MSDPSRLRDDVSTDGFELALLRSAKSDREPDDGAARALAALGLAATGGAVGLAASATAPATGATSSAASVAGGFASVASVAGGAVAAKVTGVVLLAAVAITGAVVGFDAGPSPTSAGGWGASPEFSPSGAPADVAGARPSLAAEAPATSSVSAAAPVATPEDETAVVVGVADLPSAAPERATVSPARGTSPRTPAVASPKATVAEELALIDQARAAIAGGDGAGAEKALDTYEARFPNGSLVLEAKLARIEMLVARGDRAGALDLGERFLREHPSTPYERRVQVLMRRAQPDATSR